MRKLSAIRITAPEVETLCTVPEPTRLYTGRGAASVIALSVRDWADVVEEAYKETGRCLRVGRLYLTAEIVATILRDQVDADLNLWTYGILKMAAGTDGVYLVPFSAFWLHKLGLDAGAAEGGE